MNDYFLRLVPFFLRINMVNPNEKGTEWDSILQVDLPGSAKQFLEKLAKKIKIEIERTGSVDVADIGCGRGELIHSLAKKLPDCKFVGYDQSTKLIRKLKKGSLSNEEFEYLKLPEVPDKSFDCILCINTLHYLQEPLLSIKSLWSIVRQKGTLIFNYPNRYYRALLPQEPPDENWAVVEKPMRKGINIISQKQIRKVVHNAKMSYLHKSGRHNIYLLLEKRNDSE